jgi:hypothetical protein
LRTESPIIPRNNESVDWNLPAFGAEHQLESIRERVSQHEPGLIPEHTTRRIALGLGRDIKSLSADPRRTSDNLIIVHPVSGFHEHPKRHVAWGISGTRLNEARRLIVRGAAWFDRHNVEGRSVLRLPRERAHGGQQQRESGK